MLKIFLVISIIALANIAGADTLGIKDGVYHGQGVLKSESLLIPNLKFQSDRTVENGVITAHTKAFLLGHVVAEASARLKADGPREQFKMIDLNTGAVAGDGRCDADACSFTATVMSGTLTLSETWIAKENGFSVINGYQDFGRKEASYEAQFVLVKKLRSKN